MNLYNFLFEQNDEDIPEKSDLDVKVGKKSRLAKDSVDDQIDSLLVKYESESIREDELNESSNKTLEYLLYEQEEALDPAADQAAADRDETEGSEKQDVPAGEENHPPIDIDQFAAKVARLSMNFETLLKVETVIFNRANDYLKEHYGEDHAERFKAILEEQFDIEIEKDFLDYDHDLKPPPQGLGAYDGGSGGGGG